MHVFIAAFVVLSFAAMARWFFSVSSCGPCGFTCCNEQVVFYMMCPRAHMTVPVAVARWSFSYMFQWPGSLSDSYLLQWPGGLSDSDVL